MLHKDEIRILRELVPLLFILHDRGRHTPGTYAEKNARRHGDRPAVKFHDRTWSWAEFNEEANRYASAFTSLGMKKGEVAAVHMENRPEFLFALCGLSKIGCVASLINNHIRGRPLVHAIDVCKPRWVLVDGGCAEALSEVLKDLAAVTPDRVLLDGGAEGTVEGARDMKELLAGARKKNPSSTTTVRTGDPFCYIYTSGTTGFPKAAVYKGKRFFLAARSFAKYAAIGPRDVSYAVLPLYHSMGLLIGFGTVLVSGGCIALREKFSASSFWRDVHDYDATYFAYIGELLRYLANQEAGPYDRNHKGRRIVGAGLRGDVWPTFVERFGISEVLEFYAQTEGNAPLINFESRPGMVGRTLFNVKLARWDHEKGAPFRNRKGFCVEAEEGEEGLLLGKITPLIRFDGYLSKGETDSKILRNVFKKRDCYFDTGDLFKLHDDRWLSFADRLGDTFRWKGENVSTEEVAEALNGFPGVMEANVYGVEVPGAEGRCGMAALGVADPGGFDLAGLAAHVTRELPVYARPYFLRLQQSIEATGTFKHIKVKLQKEGFDPSKVSEPLYLLDPEKPAYLPLKAAKYKAIMGGKALL